MDRLRERRKNYYIGKKFQKKFIMKFCALIIMGSFISGAIIYLMSKATVTTIFENSRLTIKSTADFILPAVVLSSAVMIILIGLATIAVTLFTSHRIAGPLYRIEKDVDDVAAGNLKKTFNLRTTDEMKSIAASLDAMVRSLRSNVVAVKNIAAELASLPANDQVKEKMKKLKEELEKFST